MTERLNISDLDIEELTKVKKGSLAEVMEKRKKPAPQQPFGQPQIVPQERKSEVEKKHIKRDGRR